MPPFITARTICASQISSKIFGLLKELAEIFGLLKELLFITDSTVEKPDLAKSHQNPKRKLEVTTDFSLIIELKFGITGRDPKYTSALWEPYSNKMLGVLGTW